MPTLKGKSVPMDVGSANPAARPEHLLQYGVMASIYAREVLGIKQPHRADEYRQRGWQRDRSRPRSACIIDEQPALRESFIGNVEGRDLFWRTG
ncbi:MAG: hypothetical protein U0872_17035 [Planctomycetaceae bacterium]